MPATTSGTLCPAGRINTAGTFSLPQRSVMNGTSTQKLKRSYFVKKLRHWGVILHSSPRWRFLNLKMEINGK
jgi:hypothetical protein